MTTSFYKTLNSMVWCGGEGGSSGFWRSINWSNNQDYYCDLYIMSYLLNQNLTTKHALKTIPFLQVYWWQSLHFTSFHSYLYSTPSVCTQSSSRKLFGWFLAQAVKFPVPRSAQVKEPSVKISFNPSQDFAPLCRCCKNTFSSLFWTSTRTEFSCRHLSSAMVQFWQVLLVK